MSMYGYWQDEMERRAEALMGEGLDEESAWARATGGDRRDEPADGALGRHATDEAKPSGLNPTTPKQEET